MRKHSIGPWTVDRWPARYDILANGHVIARTTQRDENGKATEEARANALLMVAAPDLLNVAEFVITHYQHRHAWPLEEMWERFATLAVEAKRAIAKSEGRTLGFEAAAQELGIVPTFTDEPRCPDCGTEHQPSDYHEGDNDR